MRNIDDLIKYLESIRKQIINGGKMEVLINGQPIEDFEGSILVDDLRDEIDFVSADC